MRCIISSLILFATLCVPPTASAADDFAIGYLQLSRDARYTGKRTHASFLTGALGRPLSAARVAIDEVKFVGTALGLNFKLERKKVADAQSAITAIKAMHGQGVRFFLLDVPGETLARIARDTRDLPLVLLNVSARDDELRAAQCQPHLLHIIPSHAMLADALAQYLVFRKWREVLVLQGPLAGDVQVGAAFARSAKRMGLKIVDTRPFLLSNDPRQRDQNNIALLTANADYDVVYVADTNGEFARDVPFHTVKPRPVVGSEGLAAAAWHWAWERHGAPQLEGRFYKRARRPMRSVDWAAWMGVKSVVEAVVRSAGTDFDSVSAFLRGGDIILDGFKGNRVNFRPWDGQMRQPILLVTHNWVVDRAPLRGFLHPTNNLDTLGYDERDNHCKL